MLLYLLFLLLFLLLVHIICNYNERARLIRKIPGPKEKFIVGNALSIETCPVKLFQLGRTLASLNPAGIYRIWFYPIAIVNVYNPDDVEKVTSTTKHNEKSIVYSFLKQWLGDGLLLSKGQKWQHRRKILTPAFHFNILKQFCIVMEDNSRRLVERLRQSQGESVDLTPVISEYTLHSICETAMGTSLEEINEAGKSYKEAIYAMGCILVKRFSRVYLILDFIFNLTAIARAQKKYLKTLHNFTGTVIEERKEHVNKHGADIFEGGYVDDHNHIGSKKKKIAMLDLLILAEKEGSIDRQGIQEEVDTFMFEGHDTTASGLTYCLMLLANHKDIQDKIYSELYEVFGDSNRDASIEDLSKMRYTECCIKESLRLYPPVHFISRNLSESVVLSGYEVPEGTICHIHVFDLHRREDLFKNALKFDPDRFLPENSIGRHPYSYIPFSAGPRNCIGQKFAIMEMKSCISRILRSFEIAPITRESDIVFKSDLVLRNTAPVCVKFIPRNKSKLT